MIEMNHTCLAFPAEAGPHLPTPERWKGWVDLRITTVSKQSVQDRYVTAITIVSCLNRHASLGNWSTKGRWTHDLSNHKPRRYPLSHRVTQVAKVIWRRPYRIPFPSPWRDWDLHLIQCAVGPRESLPQTGPQSVQPFSQGKVQVWWAYFKSSARLFVRFS